MPTPPLSDADVDKTQKAVDKTRNPDGSVNISAAARLIGIRRSTMQHRLKLYPALAQRRFSIAPLPSSMPSIDELLERRTRDGDRSLKADAARNLVNVSLHIGGPIGVWCWGDPHVDDDGCNLSLLRRHVELAKHPAIFSLHIGDIANFWVGRLARLYADQSTSAREAWMLVEWLLTQHEHLAVVLGNHDCWNGHGNPIDWILRSQGALLEAHGVRLALRHPCGEITRVHARHDFSGKSIYRVDHGLRRELAMGFRDHLLIAGHLHSGSDSGVCIGDGTVAQLVRVSGYKQVDGFAKSLGFPPAKIHPSCLVIIDPREPETSRARVWAAPTVEIGVKVLDTLRADYEAGKKRAAR
jgi:hypothetical protein